MPTIIDGTAGITFPVTAGSASAVQASSGRVLQVVSYTANTLSNLASTTSQTLSSTGFSVSITPSNSTSKILVMVQSTVYINNTGNSIFTIYRGSTNLASGSNTPQYLSGLSNSNGSTIATPFAMNVLDSPTTTSATTYTVYFAGTTGVQTQFGISIGFAGNSNSIITAMEIAA